MRIPKIACLSSNQSERWVAFSRNQKDDLATIDLFTVPTASLRLLAPSSRSN